MATSLQSCASHHLNTRHYRCGGMKGVVAVSGQVRKVTKYIWCKVDSRKDYEVISFENTKAIPASL
jgi:hypothetical protein